MISKKRMAAFSRDLGARIAALRARAGQTQEQLAERLDSAKSVVSRMENGGALPSMTRLVEISDALGAEMKEFFIFDAVSEDEGTERAVARVAALLRQVEAQDAKLIAGIVETLVKRLRE